MRSFIIVSKYGTFEVLVDDEDYDQIIQYNWHIGRQKSKFRVERNHKAGIRRLHRFILNISDPSIQVDHIDRNPLNNQKNNLRIVSVTENNRNIALSKRNTSGYKGVSWHKTANKWTVRIHYNGKYHSCGLYDNVKDAARAYNEKALEYYKEFAFLNKVD